MDEKLIEAGTIINKAYKIIKKVGSGSFGNVYKAETIENNVPIAIKVECVDSKKSRLASEYNVYKLIQGNGIPKVYYFNSNSEKKILVISYLGPCLEDLFDFCGRRFSIKTICMIAIQLIDRLEHIHNQNIIHRDIKPENFLIGTGKDKSKIFLIDFGLSKFYVQEGEHIQFKNNKNFTGTYRYSSIRNHRGIEQSRRDDLESIGYMLIYFANGFLPWQGLNITNKAERNKTIYEKKRKTSIKNIIGELPNEFYQYLRYTRLLRFSQDPDYDYLKNLFYNILNNIGEEIDFNFDWNILAKKK